MDMSPLVAHEGKKLLKLIAVVAIVTAVVVGGIVYLIMK